MDAAHTNDLCRRRSMTGYALLLNYGVISYCSKTQSTTATSSTKAEFLDTVTAAKQSKYLRAVLLELGYPQDGPTPLYEDNMSAINMINNRVPNERSCHIDIQHFAIRDWAEAKDIVLRHIAGVLSIPDGLELLEPTPELELGGALCKHIVASAVGWGHAGRWCLLIKGGST